MDLEVLVNDSLKFVQKLAANDIDSPEALSLRTSFESLISVFNGCNGYAGSNESLPYESYAATNTIVPTTLNKYLSIGVLINYILGPTPKEKFKDPAIKRYYKSLLAYLALQIPNTYSEPKNTNTYYRIYVSLFGCTVNSRLRNLFVVDPENFETTQEVISKSGLILYVYENSGRYDIANDFICSILFCGKSEHIENVFNDIFKHISKFSAFEKLNYVNNYTLNTLKPYLPSARGEVLYNNIVKTRGKFLNSFYITLESLSKFIDNSDRGFDHVLIAGSFGSNENLKRRVKSIELNLTDRNYKLVRAKVEADRLLQHKYYITQQCKYAVAVVSCLKTLNDLGIRIATIYSEIIKQNSAQAQEYRHLLTWVDQYR